jgi:hypothetical protein
MTKGPEADGGSGDVMPEIIYRILGTMGVGPMSEGAITERVERWAGNDPDSIQAGPFVMSCVSAEQIVTRWPFAEMPASLPKGKNIPEPTFFSDLRKLPAGRLVVVEGVPARQDEASVRLWSGAPQERVADLNALRLHVPELSLLRGVRLGLSVRLGEPVGEHDSMRDATIEAVHAVEQPLTELELRRGLRQGQPGQPLGYIQGQVRSVEGDGQIKAINVNTADERWELGLPKVTDISGSQGWALGFHGRLARGQYVRMRVAPGDDGHPLIVEPPVIHLLD